jgi:hypothetical protein
MKTTSTLKLDTYGCKLVLIVTDKLKAELKQLFKKHKLIENSDLDAEGLMVSPTMDIYYMLIDQDCLSHNTIAHEAFHAVNMIMKDREIHDEESGAWLAGHINEFIYKSINKKKLTITNG